MAKILDGKRIASEIETDVAKDVERLKALGITPKLTVVLVGDHPASAIYVRGKERAAARVGMDSEIRRLPATISQDVLLAEVAELNADDAVDGILVQLPLPSGLAEQEVLDAISPEKDVDGFHPMNAGKNFLGLNGLWPCTPSGIMEMFSREGITVEGKHAVVVGRSNIVGKPMAMLLLEQNATVTICHSRTRDLSHMTQQADILVAAIGRPNFFTREHLKPGSVVVDVGMNRLDGKVVGDVDFESASEVAQWITPVPGGVGPLTIATLLRNTVRLCEQRRSSH